MTSETQKAYEATPGSTLVIEQAIAPRPKAVSGHVSERDIQRVFAKGVADSIRKREDKFRHDLIAARVAYASERGAIRDRYIAEGSDYLEASRRSQEDMDALGRTFSKVWDDNADAAAYVAKIEKPRSMSEAPRSGYYPGDGLAWSKEDRDRDGNPIPCPPFGCLIIVKREDRVFGGIKFEPMRWEYGAWSRHRMAGVFFDTNPTLLGFFTLEDVGLVDHQLSVIRGTGE